MLLAITLRATLCAVERGSEGTWPIAINARRVCREVVAARAKVRCVVGTLVVLAPFESAGKKHKRISKVIQR